jgi:hypothetical protein
MVRTVGPVPEAVVHPTEPQVERLRHEKSELAHPPEPSKADAKAIPGAILIMMGRKLGIPIFYRNLSSKNRLKTIVKHLKFNIKNSTLTITARSCKSRSRRRNFRP